MGKIFSLAYAINKNTKSKTVDDPEKDPEVFSIALVVVLVPHKFCDNIVIFLLLFLLHIVCYVIEVEK